jgi:DNA end-binding protein Ku
MSVLANPSTLPTAAGNGCALPAAAPPGRPSWSGILRISLVAVPIKAYPAVTSSGRAPQAHLLHADCGLRIAYHKHCPSHGPLPAEAIVKGYEYAPDRYVVVDSQELDRLRPARDKALLLEQCIPVAQVDPTLFAGRSLYLLLPIAHNFSRGSPLVFGVVGARILVPRC